MQHYRPKLGFNIKLMPETHQTALETVAALIGALYRALGLNPKIETPIDTCMLRSTPA